jgi:hypothetical protein
MKKPSIVAFPCHTLLPLDDGLPIIPPLTRSSSHRRLQLNGRSCLPVVEDDKSKTQFKRSPIWIFHIGIAKDRTAMAKFTSVWR